MLAPETRHAADSLLIDVSRLIWRLWTGRLPTGIDRVCLAYVEHFRMRAVAAIQWNGRHIVLGAADSRRLLAVLIDRGPHFRRRLISVLAQALPRAGRAPRRGQLYLNIGHTGLDDPSLGRWIARHGVRAIYLIHDLIPIDSPEFCRPGEAERHAQRMAYALASASGIITNSAATLESLCGFAANRGLPCPPTVAAWLAGHALPADIAVPPPEARPYFVTVGTIEGRKNHILLLRLWKRMAERLGADAPKLVMVGQRGWEADHALAMLDRSAALKGAVIELGRCSDAELARLLLGARALLMPSFAEGFGMPVIEALQLGTPVIASDLAVFREIAGDIPTYLAAFDGVGWERAILDFCGASIERARQIAAMEHYHAPDWSDHFARVEPWLATLA